MMDTGAFLDALLGQTEGWASAPTLTGGQWEMIDGKLKNPTGDWRERFFAWPAQRDKLIEHITRDADRDVYLNPYVRPEKRRIKAVVPEVLQVVHGDADGGVELSTIVELGAAAVCSGQEGHFHVYVLLTEPVTEKQHRVLEEGLRAKISGDDKITPNDVLRPVGAINRKTLYFGLPPGEVTVAHWPEDRITPQELAARLGVDLDGEPKSKERKPRVKKEPEAPEPTPDEPIDFEVPEMVATELAIATGDRSEDHFRILGACRDAGLSMEQGRAVVRSREDLRGRLDGRDDDDVAATWERLEAKDNKDWQAKARANAQQAKTTPEPEPVDGAQVLDRVAAWFRRFIVFTEDSDADLITLWCAHTHLAAELRISARLQLDSLTFGSGKTTLLEHLKALCLNSILLASTSSAVIPRLVDMRITTLLLDEVDRMLAPGKEGVTDLIQIINSGHRFGSSRTVLVAQGNDWVPAELSTFAPVALAGNSPQLPDDTMSRALRVLLMPDVEGEAEDTDWPSIEDEAQALAADLAAWADSVRETISVRGVKVPGVHGRELERWRGVKVVALAAGGRWPAVADSLISHGLAEAQALRESGVNRVPPRVQLLTDLHKTWQGQEKFMATSVLCARLIAENPTYWGAESRFGRELTGQRLGKMIADATKQLDGLEHSQRLSATGPRGYFRYQFEKAWQRLGLPPVTGPAHSARTAESASESEPDDAAKPSEPSPPGAEGQGNIPGPTFSDSRIPCPGCSEPIPANLDNHWVCGWSR